MMVPVRNITQLPFPLSEKNKENRLSIETSLLSKKKNNPLFKDIIIGDEKWVLYNNFQRKKTVE